MYETKIYSPEQIKEDAAVNDHAPNLQRLRYANFRYFTSLNNIVTKTNGDATIHRGYYMAVWRYEISL